MAADKKQMWLDCWFFSGVSRNPTPWGQGHCIIKATFYKSLRTAILSQVCPKPKACPPNLALCCSISTCLQSSSGPWTNWCETTHTDFMFFSILIEPNASHSAWPSAKPRMLIPNPGHSLCLLSLWLPSCWVGPEKFKKLESSVTPQFHILLV